MVDATAFAIAAVKAQALRDLADDLPNLAGWHSPEMETIRLAQKRIRLRADQIEEQARGSSGED